MGLYFLHRFVATMISYFFLLYCTWCAVSVSAVRNGRVGDHGDRVRLPAPVYSALDITKVTPDGLLGDWRLAQSPTLDYRGQHYYFLSSDHDLVSSQMQKGTWENRLNVMFKDLWDNRLPAEKNMIVMDVGVNFGNFYMYAASMGCHMLGFEMQPKLYNIVEMSIRLSGYKHHSNLVNNAVWFSQLEMSFTPVVYGPKQSNLGYTHLLQDGKGDIRINTTRIDAVLANPRVRCASLHGVVKLSDCSVMSVRVAVLLLHIVCFIRITAYLCRLVYFS